MNIHGIFTGYLIPVMIQISVIAVIAAVLKKSDVALGYESAVGMSLIALAGVSSALWGVLYQCRYNNKTIYVRGFQKRFK